MKSLIDRAAVESVPALSLSVEPDNPAARLYERLGFEVVGVVGGAHTMVLDLTAAASPASIGGPR